MTKLESIEDQIKQLSASELAQLREWLAEHDWSEWDRQIERDSASGGGARRSRSGEKH